MPCLTKSSIPALGAAALLALPLLAGADRAHGQAGGGPSFESMAGSWSGSGAIRLSSGANERIRCRATYYAREGGKALQQDLRCASDSYKFEVKSYLVNQGGTISGNWSESSYQVTGSVTGKASSDRITARVAGLNFSAELDVTTTGDQQQVTIRPQGVDVTEVSIKLARGKA